MAGAGARVAKHGGRSASSLTGSADVMEALGVRISMTPEEAASAIQEIGIGFLFAPNLHPAMKHAAPVRRELKMRTVFNLIGPLANPARAPRQLIGAPSPEAAKLMAEALAALGTDHSFIVHGHDGLDEITTTGPTDVYEVRNARVEKHLWMPSDFGVKRAFGEDLLGGDAEKNAAIAQDILNGEHGAKRDIVIVNAAAGLVASALAKDLREGVEIAEKSINSGAAAGKLKALQKKFPAS
jgi:anthranilate phosphoribosyltransferase